MPFVYSYSQISQRNEHSILPGLKMTDPTRDSSQTLPSFHYIGEPTLLHVGALIRGRAWCNIGMCVVLYTFFHANVDGMELDAVSRYLGISEGIAEL